VTIDITSLALKSGNAAILRGGSETIRSNRELVALIRETLDEHCISEDTIQFIDSPDRALVQEMLRLYDDIDLIIPRGGAGLHKFCKENSLIPVIVGGMGICHLYVDETADLEKALEIIYNAKVQRPSVCNALDTLLVNQAIAADFLPRVIAKLEPARVKFKIAADSVAYLKPDATHGIELAGRDDFDTEWMSLILGLRVVNDLEEAIAHIALHSTAHSDGILSQNSAAQQQFVNQVDSAAVYVNASTRFTDGAQFGLGAEVAISTQKVHARGPMALEELTSYKWVVWGDGQVRP
jgi:glutamate-5-semialdehyde dehydrogenase